MSADILEYITVLTILFYIPAVCISDWKTRTFEFLWFTPLIVIGGFSTLVYLIESPARNIWLLALSLVFCGVLFLLAVIKAIGGADFWFASFIILFVQYNPFVVPRSFFALDFFVVLMLTGIYLPVIIWAYNYEKKIKLTFWKHFTTFPGGIPFMLPISFAFIITLFLEMIAWQI
jgi:hypothetical protein